MVVVGEHETTLLQLLLLLINVSGLLCVGENRGAAVSGQPVQEVHCEAEEGHVVEEHEAEHPHRLNLHHHSHFDHRQ